MYLPVFDAAGERRGVVLLSLNWDYLTSALRQAMLLDQDANAILIDAQDDGCSMKASRH